MRKIKPINSLSKKNVEKQNEKEIEKSLNAYLSIFALVKIVKKVSEIYKKSGQELNNYVLNKTKLELNSEILDDYSFPKSTNILKAYLKITNNILVENSRLIAELKTPRLAKTYKMLKDLVYLDLKKEYFKNSNELYNNPELNKVVELLCDIKIIDNCIRDVKHSTLNKDELLNLMSKQKITRLRRINTLAKELIVYPVLFILKHDINYYYNNQLQKLDFSKVNKIII